MQLRPIRQETGLDSCSQPSRRSRADLGPKHSQQLLGAVQG